MSGQLVLCLSSRLIQKYVASSRLIQKYVASGLSPSKDFVKGVSLCFFFPNPNKYSL